MPEAAHHRRQDLQERLPQPLHRQHGLLRIHARRRQQLPSELDAAAVEMGMWAIAKSADGLFKHASAA